MIPQINDSVFDEEGKSLNAQQVTEHLQKLKKDSESKKGLFVVKEASQWIEEAKKRAIPKMLFSEFWHEGELCILFADTNTGKSILAVQIGESIATGNPIQGFKLEATKQNVLYLDFELSDKQFEIRYSNNYTDHFVFPKSFYRAEIDPEAEIPEDKFEENLNLSLEKAIIGTGSNVLIVDNITYLKNETEKAKDALPLMKHLKSLKTKYNLSILALAHTPKIDSSQPINKNHLQGSKMLINFCDSSFTIGQSHQESGLRYLKQIKARNTEIKYNDENVMLCEICKPTNFLMFKFLGHANEEAHLKKLGSNQRDELIFRAKDMQKEGRSQREIAQELQISLGSVNKYLKT